MAKSYLLKRHVQKLGDMLQSKELHITPKLIEKYMMNKARYMKNIKFDPSKPTLSICI